MSDVDVNAIGYACGPFGFFRCSANAKEVMEEFDGDSRLNAIRTLDDIDPLTKGGINIENIRAVEIINKALMLLGLVSAKELRDAKGYEVWGKPTVKALKKFCEIAGVPHGTINGEEAPGKVFGHQTAKKLYAALKILNDSKGKPREHWKTAIKNIGTLDSAQAAKNRLSKQ